MPIRGRRFAPSRADQAAMDLAGSQPLVALMPKPFTLEDLQKQLTAFAGVAGGQRA